VAIDEIHVIVEWGQDWRKSYSRLALFRRHVGRGVPWFGTSATLDPVMLEDVKKLARFTSDVLVQYNPVDRPDITYNVQRVQYPLNTYRDLEFVLAAAEESERTSADSLTGRLTDGLTEWSAGGIANEGKVNIIRRAIKAGDLAAAKDMIQKVDLAAVAILNSSAARKKEHGNQATHGLKKGDHLYSRSRCCRILKTIIYMDTIAHIQKAATLLTLWLVRMGCSKTSSAKAIRVYHSELAEFDKRAVSTEFCKPDVEDCRACSSHRIILATDAMGMGINNPDIRRIVQWQLPSSICSLLQRAGRAARSPNIQGEFIWLVEP
jgi:superfamily II DNA helicase RecQ